MSANQEAGLEQRLSEFRKLDLLDVLHLSEVAADCSRPTFEENAEE